MMPLAHGLIAACCVGVVFFASPAAAIRVVKDAAECEAFKAAMGLPCTPGETLVDTATEGILAGSPHLFLESRACKGANVSCLDPEFAKMVQAFVLAGEEAGKQQGWKMPYITDGYRSPAAQAAALARRATQRAPCEGHHNYGLAVDFNSDDLRKGLTPAVQWMRLNAARYGFRIVGPANGSCGNSLCDPAHFELAVISRQNLPRNRCGICNSGPTGRVQSCTGGGEGGVVANAGNAIGNAFSQIMRPLTDLLRPQPATPQAPSALPSTKGPDVFGTTTPVAPLPNTPPSNMPPANFPSTQSMPPQTAEEILAQITVAPPQATTTATTTRPLTADEIRRFYEEQARLGVVVPAGSTLISPTGIQPVGAAPYAGFFTEEELNREPSQEVIRYYYQVLTRVSFALAEIIRILRGDPPYDPNNPTWLTE